MIEVTSPGILLIDKDKLGKGYSELIKSNQISKDLQIPQRTIERYLKDKNSIEFRGSPKSGGYHAV